MTPTDSTAAAHTLRAIEHCREAISQRDACPPGSARRKYQLKGRLWLERVHIFLVIWEASELDPALLED